MPNAVSSTWPDLKSLFAPRSVAIVGASEQNAFSRDAFGQLVRGRYRGEIYLVNNRRPEVFGRSTVASLADIKLAPELALIAVRADRVVEVMYECERAGVRAAVVVATGFTDAAGRRWSEELQQIASRAGIAMCGPTCLGVQNVHGGFRGWAASTQWREVTAGSISVVSQSGGTANLCVEIGTSLGLGFSYVVSSGAEACLDTADFVAHFVSDPATRVICAFVEELRHPEKFVAAAREALIQGKPILLIKAGRSDGAARVATAHTGALTGADDFNDALFRELRVIRCTTVDDMLGRAALMARSESRYWPRGKRVAIVSSSGGTASITADEALRLGFDVPDTEAADNIAVERSDISGEPKFPNPIEVSNQTRLEDPSLRGRVIFAMASSVKVDAVLIVKLNFDPVDPLPEMLAAREATGTTIAWASAIPTVATLNSEQETRARTLGLPVFPTPTGALVAIGTAADYVEARERALQPPPGDEIANGYEIPEPPGSQVIGEYTARQLLSLVGISGPREALVSSPVEAVAGADEIGYPVVLKVVSSDVTHRTDNGLILLDLRTPTAVSKGATQLLRAFATKYPDFEPCRLLVQELVSGVAELYVGAKCDLGHIPLMRVGPGGVLIELMGDGVYAVGQVTHSKALGNVARDEDVPDTRGLSGPGIRRC